MKQKQPGEQYEVDNAYMQIFENYTFVRKLNPINVVLTQSGPHVHRIPTFFDPNIEVKL